MTRRTERAAMWRERWERWKWAVLTFLRHPDTYMYKHRNHYDDLIPDLPLPLESRHAPDPEAVARWNEWLLYRRNLRIAEYEREQAEKRARASAGPAAAAGQPALREGST